MKRIKFRLMIYSASLLASLVFLYIGLRCFERMTVWVPKSGLVGSPGDIGLQYQDVTFQSSGGAVLHGWYVTHEHPVATLLFCHGNAGNISYRLESLRQFHSIGLNVFIFDYRGYGESKGWLSEDGTYRDAMAAYEWLRAQNPQRPLVIFGRSLGAAIAVDLASQVESDGAVIESGFTSINNLGEEIYPFLPVRAVSVIDYKSIEKIPKLKAPVMVVHSVDDELIPFHHGKQLFEAAPEPKRFMEIHGSHNDGFSDSETQYLAGFKSYLKSIGAQYPEGSE
ncbi:alpha/beta hydrolase [bacterium]|nr:alpha/beta hydrolase [bacterium]